MNVKEFLDAAREVGFKVVDGRVVIDSEGNSLPVCESEIVGGVRIVSAGISVNFTSVKKGAGEIFLSLFNHGKYCGSLCYLPF